MGQECDPIHENQHEPAKPPKQAYPQEYPETSSNRIVVSWKKPVVEEVQDQIGESLRIFPKKLFWKMVGTYSSKYCISQVHLKHSRTWIKSILGEFPY